MKRLTIEITLQTLDRCGEGAQDAHTNSSDTHEKRMIELLLLRIFAYSSTLEASLYSSFTVHLLTGSKLSQDDHNI
jgi:hypothetical protein